MTLGAIGSRAAKRILISFLFLSAVKLFLSVIVHSPFNTINVDSSSTKDLSLQEEIFVALILGPIIETLVFQLLIIELMLKIKISHKLLFAIFTSGLLFSITHYSSLWNIFFALISGVLYASFYVYTRLETQSWYVASSLTLGCHVVYNLYELFRYSPNL